MIRDAQRRVATFVATHDIDAPPAYRLLDATPELGELAKEGSESTAYGADSDAVDITPDELGDTLFALLALVGAADTDATTALEKYNWRLDEGDSPASGE